MVPSVEIGVTPRETQGQGDEEFGKLGKQQNEKCLQESVEKKMMMMVMKMTNVTGTVTNALCVQTHLILPQIHATSAAMSHFTDGEMDKLRYILS